MTTQSAELLRRSEAEAARLRRQASEHTARVEKAQLRMQDMREQLGSAQVGGGGEEDGVQGLLQCRRAPRQGMGSTGLCGGSTLQGRAWGRGDNLQSRGAVAGQGRGGLQRAAGQEDGQECRNLQCRLDGQACKLAGRGSLVNLAA